MSSQIFDAFMAGFLRNASIKHSLIAVALNEWFVYLAVVHVPLVILGGKSYLMVLTPTHCLVYEGFLSSMGTVGNGCMLRCSDFDTNFGNHISNNFRSLPRQAYILTCFSYQYFYTCIDYSLI